MLVVEDKFVFLHFPRTGGFSLTRMLEKHFNTEWYGFHAPYSMIPFKYRTLPKISFVRHPVDWYSSVFNFAYRNLRNVNNDNIYRAVLGNSFSVSDCIRFLLDPTAEQVDKALHWYTPMRIQQGNVFDGVRNHFVMPKYWYQNPLSLYKWKWTDLLNAPFPSCDAQILRYEDRAEIVPQVLEEYLGGDRPFYEAMMKAAPYHNKRISNKRLEPDVVDLIIDRESLVFKEFDYS